MIDSFKGLDGVVYRLTPQTLGDLDELANYWQYREWFQFQRREPHFPPDLFKARSDELFLECSRRECPNDDEQQQALNTTDGTMYVIYLSLRHKHPDITYEKVSQVVGPEHIQTIAYYFYVTSGRKAMDDAARLSAAEANESKPAKSKKKTSPSA